MIAFSFSHFSIAAQEENLTTEGKSYKLSWPIVATAAVNLLIAKLVAAAGGAAELVFTRLSLLS